MGTVNLHFPGEKASAQAHEVAFLCLPIRVPSQDAQVPCSCQAETRGPPEELQGTEHVCACQRVMERTETSRKAQHSVPTRTGSHRQKGERDSGNCFPRPQPMRLQPPGNPAPPLGTGSVKAWSESWGPSEASSQPPPWSVSEKKRSPQSEYPKHPRGPPEEAPTVSQPTHRRSCLHTGTQPPSAVISGPALCPAQLGLSQSPPGTGAEGRGT